MNDKLLSFIGLCRRANRLCYGFDAVTKSVNEKKTQLVLFANDTSNHTVSDIENVCKKCGVKTLTLDYNKEQLSLCIGKNCAVIAICDSGFANKICELFEMTKEVK